MLLLPKFDFYEPADYPEALRLLGELREDAKIVAGGTDVLVNMKKGTEAPKYLISLRRIRELAGINEEQGSFAMGSQVIVSRLAETDGIRRHFPVLAEAASVLGSPLIRNRATIGGNIATARPAADLPPALLALGARVRLESQEGSRDVPLDEFFLGPGKTVLRPGELLREIIIDKPHGHTGGAYRKLGHRNSLEIAIVAVASRLTLDGPQGVVKEAKVVLSAVAPTVIHARSAEQFLLGKEPTEALLAEAGKLAGHDCSPITDLRGSAEYRCAMVEVLTKRTLKDALQQAKLTRQEA
jgi:CO/xanthine dehydrogenase FAD-binding subunit